MRAERASAEEGSRAVPGGRGGGVLRLLQALETKGEDAKWERRKYF
jgi:hypothetical protein